MGLLQCRTSCIQVSGADSEAAKAVNLCDEEMRESSPKISHLVA